MSEKGRFYDDLLALTKHLVSIPSVSPTAGEINIADEIEKIFVLSLIFHSTLITS